MTYKELKEHICDLGFEDAIVFENPDYAAAYIGMSNDDRVVYSYDRMIECLMEEDGMTYEEAIEFIDFNTIRALPYMGDRGPIVLYDDPEVVDVDALSKDDDIDCIDNE